MPDAQMNVLSYARRMNSPRRFRHMWAVIPFGVGLLIGDLLLACVLGSLPDFAVDSIDSGILIAALYVAPIVGSVYAFAVLLFLGFISTHPRVAQPFWLSATIGITFQMFAVGLYAFFAVLFTVVSPPPWLETAGFLGAVIIVFFTGTAAPFGLLRWRESKMPLNLMAHPGSAWLKRLSFLGFCIILFVVARWAAVRAFERDCQSVAAWAKASYPTTGSYLAIPLPNSQRLLSGDGKVDATVLPDGRIVLVLRMFVDDSENGRWSEIIYASGPIAPGEFGKDPFGGAHILIGGLSEHVIKQQVDAQHFNAVSPHVSEGW